MKKIKEIVFTLFSPDQIREMSALKVIVPDTYDEDGYPISGGLADQHLGVIDPGLKCKTCGGTIKTCPGHFGHIELVRPVVHPGFAKIIHDLLNISCSSCGKIIGKGKTKPKKCPYCGAEQKEVTFIKPTTYYEGERKLLPNEIRERLEKIPTKDLEKIGIKIRPEWMVLTVLLVPPVNVRPSIILETGQRSEDDLTHKLVDIIRINQRLGENIDAGAPQLIIEDLWELLQYHVATYFDNELSGLPAAKHRSGRPLKTLIQRLKGKEGRFRYNLSGKRVNFSARTVISPDPYLGINHLGVPEEIAKELTIPLHVTLWNVNAVKRFIKEQPEKINYVIRPDGRRKKITELNKEEIVKEIDEGYTVERQLLDGDLVIFNRQPSLHRISMMAHEVRVMPGKTFRFNVADCPPYNADFDGDEMNVHVPQTEEAQSESEILMKVQNQVLSPRHGGVIISLDLDQISGIFLLTQDWMMLPKDEAFEILYEIGIEKKLEGEKISGKKIFSFLLPSDFGLKTTSREGEEVEIKNGKLVKGYIDSKTSSEIIREMFLKYGPQKTREYLDRITYITSMIAAKYGLTLSLEDYEMGKKGNEEIKEIYRKGNEKAIELINSYKHKKMKRLPGKTLRETLEGKLMDVFEHTRDSCARIINKNIRRTTINYGDKTFELNNALMMSKAGAKGKILNVIQMAAMVGQQAVRGKRMHAGYNKRILSHFKPGILGAQARGFINRSYIEGLNPYHYFFHGAGGRDSVVDKGVNPAKTGYMQRRLINALLDLTVKSDLSVKDADGNIIEFKYGDDGREATGEKILPGEAVGVVAAQSIGEPGTQMTLRTFHYAGVASLAQFGFNRLVEIVDGRKTPKKAVMEIYIKPQYQQNRDKAIEIASKIEEISLKKVSKIFENFDKKNIEIVVDEGYLKSIKMKREEIKKKIKRYGKIEETEKGFIVTPKVTSLRGMRRVTNNLSGLLLRGIPGIKRAIIMRKENQYVIATEGSNLKKVFEVEEIDSYKSSTNDIFEVKEFFGIEAARNAIINEIKKLLDAQKLKVDERHMMLIADAMTYTGDIKSVGRHGIAGGKSSVLARAAFEETSKHLFAAALTEESDKLKGVTENILIGQTIPVGTGTVKLVMKPTK